MQKYFLAIGITFFVSYAVAESLEEFRDRLNRKRFEKLESFEQELETYGFVQLDQECLKDKEESCFVLEKLMEKEVKDFIEIVREMASLEKEENEPLKFDSFPEFFDKYFPGISNDWKEWIRTQHIKSLQKCKERRMKGLKKMECQSTADVDGLKKYMECRKVKLKKKYKRLQEKYPNEPEKGIFGGSYTVSDKNWLSNLRTKKFLCTKGGQTQYCVQLQKMRKK